MANQIRIESIEALKDNYIWSIVDEENHSTLIVDPGDAAPVENYLKAKRLSLCGILITHHHWDHTNGIELLRAGHSCPVYGPSAIPAVTEPVEQTVSPRNFPLNFTVIAIPGHTLEHVAYLSQGSLFSGDTLFAAGCGRIFEGKPEQMYQSLQKLADLPQETKLYCGHEYTLKNLQFAQMVDAHNLYIEKKIQAVSELRQQNHPSLPSTLLDEKETNPFLRCTEKNIIASCEKFAGRKLPTPIEVFTVLRKWKDTF